MKITLHKAEHFITKPWSGGTTTQLFIYPETASYQQLNFDFRISTARVDVATSVFTPLVGVSRKLLVLEGKMTLHHEGYHSAKVGKLDVDIFEGGWKTTSEGKCVDFNVMMREGVEGDVYGKVVEKGHSLQLFGSSVSFCFVFLHQGQGIVSSNQQSIHFSAHDFISVHDYKGEALVFLPEERCEIVMVEIQ